MKKQYLEPEMEVVGLSREDMIRTSAVECEEEWLCDEEELPCGGCNGKPGEER